MKKKQGQHKLQGYKTNLITKSSFELGFTYRIKVKNIKNDSNKYVVNTKNKMTKYNKEKKMMVVLYLQI